MFIYLEGIDVIWVENIGIDMFVGVLNKFEWLVGIFVIWVVCEFFSMCVICSILDE